MDTKTLNMEPYRKAVRERVCSFCLDHGPTGCTRQKDDPCSLVTHLEQIVPAILDVRRSRDIRDYSRALRARVCQDCREDESGACSLRDLAECAVDAYLLRIVEVIEQVAAAEGHLAPPRPLGAN